MVVSLYIGLLIDLINRTFIRENTQYLACKEGHVFFTSYVCNITIYDRVKTSVMPFFIFWIIFFFDFFDLELNFISRQTISIPMGTNSAPLVSDLFCFFVRDFMKSLSRTNQADIIEAFSLTLIP